MQHGLTAEQLDSLSEEEMMKLLIKLGMIKVSEPITSTRPLFDTFDSNGVAKFIKEGKAKNILVMTGAGISTAAGIPDFRSPKTGLYHQLEKYNLPYAEAIFTLDYFRQKPEAFCTLAKELYPDNFSPTPCHFFVKLMDEKGLLLRNYTQNIDTLERATGLNVDRLVEAHGSFGESNCIDCQAPYSAEFVKDIIFKDEIPKCTKCNGLVKANIVFFGEKLPQRFHKSLMEDEDKVDMLIVIGTSLKVHPFAGIVDQVATGTPRVLINMDPVGSFDFEAKTSDVALLGDCQVSVLELADNLGWYDELIAMSPKDSTSFKSAIEKYEEKKKSNLLKGHEK